MLYSELGVQGLGTLQQTRLHAIHAAVSRAANLVHCFSTGQQCKATEHPDDVAVSCNLMST